VRRENGGASGLPGLLLSFLSRACLGKTQRDRGEATTICSENCYVAGATTSRARDR